jgi:aquaglyceroporin related protein
MLTDVSESDSEGSLTPLKRSTTSQPETGDLQSFTKGRMPNVRQPTANSYSLAGKQRNDGSHSNSESAPVNHHGLDGADQGSNGRNNFGLQDGLHPLQELDTHATTQTQKEHKEVQKREHEEQQEYYNQYRNPIARFRAQYPQAPAEFLAVRLSNLSLRSSLTKPDIRIPISWNCGQPICRHFPKFNRLF